ncbi:MAG: tetratricopeptide repeat protein [Anaerolineae bacterium]|jgi:Ca-activated chloride channel family protein|nr:tetratricopeptide repeat protein [Anaerolineae bacterium]
MKRRRWGWLLVLLLTACGVNPAERNNAANWYSAQGQYDAAVAAYQSAQVAAPDEARLYFNAAQALAAAGDVPGAVAALQQAIQRGDVVVQAQAYYNLGNLYAAQQQYPEAVAAYQQALLRQPQDAAARHNLETVLLFIQQPTPTALEQKTRPEQQQADVSATPTPNPAALSQPSPTPTPPPFAPPSGPTPAAGALGEEETGENKGTPLPRPDGDFTAEEARQLLDQIKQDQPGIGGMPTYTVPDVTPPSGRDW